MKREFVAAGSAAARPGQPCTVPAQTFAEKALARAAGLPYTRAGDLVQASPHHILSHDNTAAIAQTFYELGVRKVANADKLCVVLDHAAPPPTPRHARNHSEIRSLVREQGVRRFAEVGRGVCHQVLSEEAWVLPGELVLGADSHTTHHGWLGAFAAGIGRSEVAALWAVDHLWMRVPESIRIHLSGSLPTGTTTKDLCLHIIDLLAGDEALYASLEFTGPALHALSLESRMVIPNMMAEAGVKNAYLAPDETVFDFLAHRLAGQQTTGLSAPEDNTSPSREDLRAALKEMALYPDSDAHYRAEYAIDLGRLEPLVACPSEVTNVAPLSAVAGRRVDLAFIGTCSNGRYEDLAAAATILDGRHVHPQTRLLVVPASSQVYQQSAANGALARLVAAGAIIGPPGCGPCMGNHLGVPGPGEVVISTANRNFKGRMGQPGARIYLASPAVVAAAAVEGRIPSPEQIGAGCQVRVIGRQSRAPASPTGRKIDLPVGEEMRSGCLQQEPPTSPSHPSGDDGRARVWKYGDDVNTDLIFPGKYTYTLRKHQEIAARALEDLDPSFAEQVKPGDVIFAGRNFGCGSSREQAALCLKINGVAAVVVVSAGRIFYRNAINQGLPVIVCPQAVLAARPNDPVKIDLAGGEIRLPAGTFTFPSFPRHIQTLLKAGGLIPLTRSCLAAASSR